MGFKVGVTTGLYTVARAEDLATAVRKVGYTITKGASVVEFAGDIPHEVTFTEGKEARDILRKQGMTASFHGSLTVPMDMPDRAEWRDADDHIKRSLRSAIHLGAVYVDFHASLNIWLELMTYAGRKLTLTFCDHRGRFIGEILKENAQLRKWFVEEKAHLYQTDILDRDDRIKVSSQINNEEDDWYKKQIASRFRAAFASFAAQTVDLGNGRQITGRQVVDNFIESAQVRGVVPDQFTISSEANRILEKIKEERIAKNAEIQDRILNSYIEKKLARGDPWDSEELRAVVGIIDGYHIMFHYLFYTRDSQFTHMAQFYSGLMKRYRLDYSNPQWPDEAWKKGERENDLEFKEFFYGVVGAKFIEGHMVAAYKWLQDEFIKKEMGSLPEKTPEQRRDKQELIRIAKNIKIGLETPDARDPSNPGRFIIWRPIQIYSAAKVVRQVMKNDFVWLIPDFEHVATQGADALQEFEKIPKIAPDYGKYVISVHSNSPNPLHPHLPIELGDMTLYRIYWALRKTGLGKDSGRNTFVLHERGGGEDPVQRSVDALKLLVKFIEQDIPPEELPPEFFGVEGMRAGNVGRQRAIVRDHAYDVMKDLLEMPEEEWTFLSQAVVKKGKRPEVWKKAEFR